MMMDDIKRVKVNERERAVWKQSEVSKSFGSQAKVDLVDEWRMG